MEPASCVVLILAIVQIVATEGPVVQLVHGGQLRGKTITFNNTPVDLYLGVPFAQPPVGHLRFKKPEPLQSWTGVKNATSVGATCPQIIKVAGTPVAIGDEDCLYLDITVPRGTANNNLKAVMVFIHGGNYNYGAKHYYFGTALATHGDVVVVAINYRLGLLGFLSNGTAETGNYGLWDQRAALVWVKENIEKFGGDPELVTIFGESAGAASVSALLVGRYSEGLFKRAIQESGSLYASWSWHISSNQRFDITEKLKADNNCKKESSVYDCLSNVSLEEIVKQGDMQLFTTNPWRPAPDEDFFETAAINETYLLSQRFDVMIGFNGQESRGSIVSISTEDVLENGASVEFTRDVLYDRCSTITPLSAELCVEFVMKLYQLGTLNSSDNKERLLKTSYFFGELHFDSDSVKQLVEHSAGSKNSYAYYFTKIMRVEPNSDLLVNSSDWLVKSADHGEEIPYVFGGMYINQEELWKEYFEGIYPPDAYPMLDYYNKQVNVSKHLTDSMLTMWTNFAKTGNPNEPVALPAGVPEWPEFDTNSNQFMELGDDIRVITTPNKERLESLSSNLYPARQAQVLSDHAPYTYKLDGLNDCTGKVATEHTTPVGGHATSPMIPITHMVVLIGLILLLC